MAKVDIEVEPPEPELVPVEDEEEEGEESEAQKRVTYDLNAPNMVPEMVRTKAGQKAVKELGDRVYNEVRDAWDASEKYRKNAKEQWRMFACEVPKRKSGAFKDAATLNVPQVLEDVSRLYMRMYIEVVGDGDEFFSVMPVGPNDKETAELLTRHGNWQLQNELIDLPPQLERAALFFIIPGDVTGHSYYDESRRVNRHEVLNPDDIIVPYVHTTTTPDYSDCPWVAKWLRLYKHELQRYRGQWHEVDTVLAKKPSWEDDDIDFPMADAQKKLDGNEPGPDQRAPYKFVHYEGWIELPDQPNELYCKVVFEWSSKKVMSLQLHMEDDWKDRARFELQSQELEAFRARTASYPKERMAYDQMVATAQTVPPPVAPMGPFNPGGIAPPATVPPPLPPPPEPPVPPPWADDPQELLAVDELGQPSFQVEPARQVPIHMFVHGKGIEPPAGPLGMGTGRILMDLNVFSNVVGNQFVDQSTFANSWGGLYAGGSTQAKVIKWTPGEWTPVPGIRPGDLKGSFLEMTPRPANPQMFDLLRFARELSEAAVAAPGVLSGDPGKSGETYRGLQTRLEQATRQISFITSKYARFIKFLIVNNAKLNARFMPEDEIVRVNDHKTLEPRELRLGRRLYDRDYRVSMKTDLRFASQAARVQEADQMLTMVATPIPGIPPNPALIQAAMRESFLARGQDQLVPLLGPPMPPPGTPMNLPPPGMVPPGAPGAPGQPGEGGAPQPQGAQVPQPPNVPQPPQPGVSGGTPSPGPEV